MAGDWVEILNATNPEATLAIALRPQPSVVASDPPDSIDVRLTVQAHPFSTIIECIWLPEDIVDLGRALQALSEDDETTIFTIAGNRALELRLGGEETATAEGVTYFEATITGPSADAPLFEFSWWPSAPSEELAAAAERVARLAAGWPSWEGGSEPEHSWLDPRRWLR